jgi:hypothetical protein
LDDNAKLKQLPENWAEPIKAISRRRFETVTQLKRRNRAGSLMSGREIILAIICGLGAFIILGGGGVLLHLYVPL